MVKSTGKPTGKAKKTTPTSPPIPRKRRKTKPKKAVQVKPNEEPNPFVEQPQSSKSKKSGNSFKPTSKPGQSEFADWIWNRKPVKPLKPVKPGKSKK